MDKIVIEGGNALKGEVAVSGSKNAALPILFATLLTDEDCLLKRVPQLEDIRTTSLLLTHLGKEVSRDRDQVLVKSTKRFNTDAPYDLVRRMRASALVLGPLLARKMKASASLPGGCLIGSRPIDIHLEGFEKLGAKTQLKDGTITLSAQKLKGANIPLRFPSVGATENLLMASALCPGRSTIRNAAREPEIVDLCNFLNEMGAQIIGGGSSVIRVVGQPKLHGAVHRVIPDRIEAATYLIAGAATRGKIWVTNVDARALRLICKVLTAAGLKIKIENGPKGCAEDKILCEYKGKIKPVCVVTGPYPLFPTDIQAQWMALMALANGRSVIVESIFENRFLHAAELLRMGAKISIRSNRAVVKGNERLTSANVMVSDLRAGAALVIAGLSAKGKTTVHRVYHLDRGYESLESKLKQVGAKIWRLR